MKNGREVAVVNASLSSLAGSATGPFRWVGSRWKFGTGVEAGSNAIDQLMVQGLASDGVLLLARV